MIDGVGSCRGLIAPKIKYTRSENRVQKSHVFHLNDSEPDRPVTDCSYGRLIILLIIIGRVEGANRDSFHRHSIVFL